MSNTLSRTMYNDLAYAPFGEQYATAGGTTVGNVSFAGNREDTTTNLYDAQFREYEIYGRWPSPDPAGTAAANPANPQSWNRYAYVLNMPFLFTDPFGLDPNGQPCQASDKGKADPKNNSSCVCDDSGDVCFWVSNSSTTVTVNGNPPPAFPTSSPIFNSVFNPTPSPTGNGPTGIGGGPGSPQAPTPQHIGTPKTTSQCSTYLQAGNWEGDLEYGVCSITTNFPVAQQMRGCLQALYNPSSGCLPLPLFIPTAGGSFFNLNSIVPGTGAHAVCTADALGP